MEGYLGMWGRWRRNRLCCRLRIIRMICRRWSGRRLWRKYQKWRKRKNKKKRKRRRNRNLNLSNPKNQPPVSTPPPSTNPTPNLPSPPTPHHTNPNPSPNTSKNNPNPSPKNTPLPNPPSPDVPFPLPSNQPQIVPTILTRRRPRPCLWHQTNRKRDKREMEEIYLVQALRQHWYRDRVLFWQC